MVSVILFAFVGFVIFDRVVTEVLLAPLIEPLVQGVWVAAVFESFVALVVLLFFSHANADLKQLTLFSDSL